MSSLITHRRRTSREEQLRERVIELREQGRTLDAIAQELRANKHTIRRILHSDVVQRERRERLQERALTLSASYGLPALERRLREGDGALALRLLEDVGVVGREAIRIQVNATNAQVNLHNDEIETARCLVRAIRSTVNAADGEAGRLLESENGGKATPPASMPRSPGLRCAACGHDSDEAARLCASCGKDLSR